MKKTRQGRTTDTAAGREGTGLARQPKSTLEDYRTLKDPDAEPLDRALALQAIASDHLTEYEPLVADLLTHPDASLRGDAIYVLLGWWGMVVYLEQAAQMLHDDPDENVRGQAAAALAGWAGLSGQSAHRERAARELVKALYAEANASNQAHLYDKLQSLLALPRRRGLPLYFDRDRDVDEALIAPYRAK